MHAIECKHAISGPERGGLYRTVSESAG